MATLPVRMPYERLAELIPSSTRAREATRELLSSGLPALDQELGGIPFGALTYIYGAAGTGRAALRNAILAASTRTGRLCALVDGADAFDPESALEAGVELSRLVWVRCRGSLDVAFQAADVLLQAGGFGVVVLDLCSCSSRALNRVPPSWWYRFRRAVESASSAMLVLSERAQSLQASELAVELALNQPIWQGFNNFHLNLTGSTLELAPRRPAGRETLELTADIAGER